MPEIYEPSEDSYLMSETLKEEIPKLVKKNKNLRFLEVGTGSGINLHAAVTGGIEKKNIVGCDINRKAVKHCSTLGFNCIKSDLFENIKGKFDIIAFNPPYLPFEKKEPKGSRTATTGGKKGNEIILRFLKQAGEHLEKEGKIFLTTSSLSPSIDFRKSGYGFKELGKKDLFFEKLFIWKLWQE